MRGKYVDNHLTGRPDDRKKVILDDGGGAALRNDRHMRGSRLRATYRKPTAVKLPQHLRQRIMGTRDSPALESQFDTGESFPGRGQFTSSSL